MSGIAILLAPLFVIVPVAAASFGFLAIASKKWWLQDQEGAFAPSFFVSKKIEQKCADYVKTIAFLIPHDIIELMQ